MAQKHLNIGAAPNDGTGDLLRDAFSKVEDNETELYNRFDSNGKILSANVVLSTAPTGAYVGITEQSSFNTKTNDLSKNQVTYPSSFLAGASYAAFCKTDGYLGYNLVFSIINTGTPPTVNIFDVDQNYRKVATVTMPTGCTNVTCCYFHEGTLYIGGGTASNSGMYRMTFAVGSTIAAPTFDVSALISTDGTTSISNTYLAFAIRPVTIGANTRIVCLYRNATFVLSHLSSYATTSTGVNFDNVTATPLHASYTMSNYNFTFTTVLSGGAYYLIISSTHITYNGVWKFALDASFIPTFPSTNTGYYVVSAYRFFNISNDSNYIYVNGIDAAGTIKFLARIAIADVITGGAMTIAAGDIIHQLYYTAALASSIFIKSGYLLMSNYSAGAPYMKWVSVTNLTTFKQVLMVEDAGYSVACNSIDGFVSKRSTDGITFEDINHYICSAITSNGYSNVIKFNML